MSGKLGALIVGALIGSALTSFSAMVPIFFSSMDSTLLMNADTLTAIPCPEVPREASNVTTTERQKPDASNLTREMSEVSRESETSKSSEPVEDEKESLSTNQNVSPLLSALEHKNRTGICRRLPPGVTAGTLWKSQAARILETSKHRLAGQELPKSYPTWLKGLFELMHTRFLRQGYRHPPLPSAMKEVLDIVDTKLRNKKSEPLNIVVVGGSVTYGRGSCVDPFKKQKLNSLDINCNWPSRLQKLFDEFLGVGTVRVTNLAVGGTSTSLSTTIIKYKLYPDDTRFLRKHGPDIIINAYSTNDALPLGSNHTYDAKYHWQQREAAQNFIRAAHASRPCSNLPLVMYVDDYLGNQHNLILGEQSNQRLTQEMAEWYGSMYISYAAAVRRLVYANQQETLLSAYWPWWSRQNSKRPRIQVHIQLSGHMALLWVVAFSMLTAVVDYCDDDYDDQAASQLFPDMFPQVVMDLVERVPPPLLNANTTLERVSDRWLAASEANAEANVCGAVQEDDDAAKKTNPCVLAFICGPMGTIRSTGVMKIFLNRTSTRTKGWKIDDDADSGGWSNKLGYVATRHNATTTFYKDPTDTTVQSLKIFYLKSYGAKWANSKAKFTLRGIHEKKKVYEKSFTLEGFHNSNTSIAYPYELDLGKNTLPKGIRVELTVTVIGGTTFKLIGMVMCNRH